MDFIVSHIVLYGEIIRFEAKRELNLNAYKQKEYKYHLHE